MSPAESGAGACPSCGEPATGNFCQHCGASLGGRFCNQCGATLEPGAKFCNQCGTAVGAGPLPATPARGAPPGRPLAEHRAAAAATFGGANLPWWIAGVALFGLILVVGWRVVHSQNPPAQQPGEAPPTAQGAPGMAGNGDLGASTIDLSSMTPRHAADLLFNRVEGDLANGDTADAMQFQPMAVQAYQVAEPLDLDGLFHESLLQGIRDPETALATAKRILATDPDHLLGLGAAAQWSAAMGDTATAVGYYKHFLKVYDAQIAKKLPEYDAHKQYLAEVRPEAQAFVAAH
jgi:Double zinc ribbon